MSIPKLSDQPLAYSRAVERVLLALVILGLVELDADQIAGIVLAVGSVLDIFVWSKVTPVARADARVASAAEGARNAAMADVASLATPKRETRARKATQKPAKKAGAR